MKTFLFTTLAVLVAVGATGQGTPQDVYINFSNVVLGGTPAQGGGVYRDHARIFAPGCDTSDLLAALFFSENLTAESATFRQAGAPTTFLATAPGFFAGGRRDLVGIQTTEEGPGPIVAFQVRVWNVNFPDSVASTRVFYSRAGNGNNSPPDVPPNFSAAPPGGRVGFTGFMAYCVPEPSSVALGLLGAGAALFVRRSS